VIPKILCSQLIKNYELGETVLVKIMRNNNMLGDFTLIMPKGKAFDKDEMVETFARQFGLALARTQAEESKKVLLDNIQTQVWYLTDECTYGSVNQAHAYFNGVEIEDLSYKNMYEILPREIVDECRRSNSEVFLTGKTLHTKEWSPHFSGEKRLLSITKAPKLRPDGSVEYVVCSANDITEQEIAYEKVQSSEEHLNALVSNTPAVIYSYTIGTDKTANLTYINDKVRNIL
jgi:PAS domain-containing protein